MKLISLDLCLHLQADYSDNVQRDLLDALLNAKNNSENNNTNTQDIGLTDDHLLMTVGDIFGAGVETTTTVLKWSIVYLIHHPKVRYMTYLPFYFLNNSLIPGAVQVNK